MEEISMRLKINNIGELRDVDIKIDGLTVIAGENSSGKSTINKALYAAFNSLNNLSERVFMDKINSFLTDLKEEINLNSEEVDFKDSVIIQNIIFDKNFIDNIKRLALLNEIDKVKNEVETHLNREIKANRLDISIENLNKDIFDIRPYLDIDDNELKKQIATKMFRAEFKGQINNIYDSSPAEISLEIKDSITNYKIHQNTIKEIKNNQSLKLQAVYIDDLYSIDNIKTPSRKELYEKNHRTALIDSFFNFYDNNITSEILKENRLKRIFSMVNDIASGDLVWDPRYGIRYNESTVADNIEDTLIFSNVSAGLKTFILLKELILGKTLKENGTIIFDEPEIHLHPEWQIKLAELIVLIQKEYGMHIVLTTHSPYFLYALEVFSTKYGISEKTNYYFSQRQQGSILVNNIGKNLEVIYNELNTPFQTLEDLTNDLY